MTNKICVPIIVFWKTEVNLGKEVRKMAKLKPLYDKIVVKRFEEQEQKTPSGIIIPDTAKEKPQMGEVIAVGEGKLLNNGDLKPLKVKEGDVVLFNKYAGTEVELDGEKYLIMSEDEVLAIVEDAKVTA